MLQQAGIAPKDTLLDLADPNLCHSPSTTGSSVEQKMVEQLQAFVSMSETKKKSSNKHDLLDSSPPGGSVEMKTFSSGDELKDSSSGEEAKLTSKGSPGNEKRLPKNGVLKPSTNEKADESEVSSGGEGVIVMPSCGVVLKEPAETEVQTCSPRRLARPPLGKTQSAGDMQGPSDGAGEFAGACHRAARALSEKSHSLLEEALLEVEGLGDDESRLNLICKIIFSSFYLFGQYIFIFVITLFDIVMSDQFLYLGTLICIYIILDFLVLYRISISYSCRFFCFAFPCSKHYWNGLVLVIVMIVLLILLICCPPPPATYRLSQITDVKMYERPTK